MPQIFDTGIIPESVPVMNLSKATLFPHAILPLYIFESRYREMLETVLQSHRLFALADLEAEAKEAQTHPAQSLIAGIGMIRACRKNTDGTSHLVLQGLSRIKLLQLSWDKPYPMATIERVESLSMQNIGQYKAIKPTLIDSIEHLVQLDSNVPDDIITFLANLDDSENVLDVAIASLCPSGAFKQK
ncbi:MAG: LON peptidase substrate-binding domain-containing protein, partial [Burkholderiales bacterium]|nr:LON peptidase substrate-binding domain-containing protein [Burkholderiales bacterium]